MLEIKGLGREFHQGDRKVWAVKDIDLTVSKGSFLSIVGRSGSGKSTLLNLIAGLLEPTVGEIVLDGSNMANLLDKEASLMRNSQIGYIVQGRSALGNLTVLENVCLPFYLFQRVGNAEKKALELIERVGISHLKNAYPAQLSGGELKRMAIARSLINSPKLLLADEPTSDLDSENTEGIMTLFRKIADQGTTVMLVTHEAETLRYGDTVYRMEAGSLKK